MRRKLIIQLTALIVVAIGGLLGNLIAGNHPALGLDLQGGISVTQVPVGKYDPDSLDLAVERIRERVDSLGVAEPEIIRQGNAIVINLPGVKNQQQAIDLVKVTGQVYLRPVQQCIAAPATQSPTTTPSGSSTSAPTTTVAGSASAASTTPTAAPASTTASSAGFKRQAPGDTTTTATSTTATTAPPESSTTIVGGGSTTTTVDPNAPTTTVALDPNQTGVLPLRDGGECLVSAQRGTGEVFKNDAAADIAQGSWRVTVSLRDGAAGTDVWNRLASQCYNGATGCESHQLAIELDGLIVSAPTVNQPSFDGKVEITGHFSESEARNLARVLKSGSLPVKLEPQAVQTVSPTLGKDSLRAAIVSGLVGVLLVVLFMLLYYRSLAWVVIGGIAISAALLWSTIALLSKTQGLALSLSGIAGIIVSVGVTVDSYVVFFERLKDEVRAGRSMRNSAQRGFTASWHTILVADLVSLIGAAVLWYLTVGSVRGFAFFLGLSTLCDLLVAYYFMRPAVLLAARTEWFARRKVMGIEAAPTDRLAGEKA